MKEIVEMTQTLLAMRTDTYMLCKYTLLLVSRDHPGTKKFVEKLFNFTDRKRPLLIGMQEDCAGE